MRRALVTAERILTDHRLLDEYCTGSPPSPLVIHRIVGVAVRDVLGCLPDYVTDGVVDISFEGQADVRAVILKALDDLGSHFLERSGPRLYLKPGVLGDWQALLTAIPPVPVLARYAGRQSFLSDTDRYHFVVSTFSKTSLPSVSSPLFDQCVRSGGLCELHLHLNGTTEFDQIWQAALQRPLRFVQYLTRGIQEPGVEMQMRQLQSRFSFPALAKLLKTAASLRCQIVRYLRCPCRRDGSCPAISALPGHCSMHGIRVPDSADAQLCASSLGPWHGERSGEERCPLSTRALRPILDQKELICAGVSANSWGRHPATALVPASDGCPVDARSNDLLVEVFMLQEAFEVLDAGDTMLAPALHAYLLIQAHFNLYVVQQIDQNGFDQFQRITQNEHRGLVEEASYLSRFFQIEGMYGNSVNAVEGRFAPKESPRDSARLLRQIIADYRRYQEDCQCGVRGDADRNALSFRQARICLDAACECCLSSGQSGHAPFDLSLTAHFIKKRDKHAGDSLNPCRHYSLRVSLEKQARSLVHVLQTAPDISSYVTGMDAAANELHAPPEVFAPIFRRLRCAGLRHATFHVGEDYHHLVSGIRAVREAIEFLELKGCCRLGHATALGIDPELWADRIGDTVAVGAGEWLDNLVFAHHALQSYLPAGKLALLEHEARSLFYRIYGRELPFDMVHLGCAWKMRRLDPLLAIHPAGVPLSLHSRQEEELHRELRPLAHGAQLTDEAIPFRLFRCYHQPSVHAASMARYLIPTRHKALTVESLSAMQEATLQCVNTRGVAIETMPSSNVRISFYEHLYEHHVARWLGVDHEREPKLPSPVIVVGSDDPGIFATNLRNEYASIYELLIHRGKSASEAIQYLEQLKTNAEAYRFRASPSPARGAGPRRPDLSIR